MNNNDTLSLLQECDAGSKMAVSSIDEVLEKVKDEKLKKLLSESKEHHTKLGNEIHQMLSSHHTEGKEPSAISKGMSWVKSNVVLSVDNSNGSVAELITDGCNMGIKTLNKFLNQYSAAEDSAKKICIKLSSIEEKLCKELQPYLL